MAAEVPVSDVLCEAMEYLTKLGSNLRTRSESLKVKRISKEKLQNAHAVQKAANKVLLICELSKKSLENVESGIRKVLLQVDASQATSDGGKCLNSRRNVTSKSDFRYFTYQSRKLKISKSKRVPLKHFISAKVLAKNMPDSMQDKYPVYYDCKMYRMRKKINAGTKRKSDETNKNISIQDLTLHDNNETNENISQIEILKYQDGNSDTEPKNNEIGNKHTSKFLKRSNTEHTESNGNDSSTSEDMIRKKSQSNSVLIDESKRKDIQESLNNKLGKLKILEDSDNDSQIKDHNCKEQDKQKYHKRKFKNVKFIDDSSNSSKDIKQEEVSEKYIGCKNETDNDAYLSESEKIILSDHKHKKRKLIDTDSETESSIFDKNRAVERNKEDEQGQESEQKKPLIKCVNITKLLKPDTLLNNDVGETSLAHKPGNCKIRSAIHSTRPSKDGKIKDHLIRESRRYSEQEYWDRKRKEVADFIPKNFVINITRLPKLSETFLHAHNLKLISHKGSVLCKVANETQNISNFNTIKDINKTNTDECNLISHSTGKNDEAKQCEDVNKVKNALLNDSDSDDRDPVSNRKLNKELSAEAEKVKNALLNDSDSDKNEKLDLDDDISNLKTQHTNSSEKISNEKDTLLKDTDSDNRNEVSNCDLNKDDNKALNEETDTSKDILPATVSRDTENQTIECENTNKAGKCSDGDDDKRDNINSSIGNHDNVDADKEVTPTKLNKDESSRSSDIISRTPLSQRKKRKQSLTPQSKRKHIMESMHAKKMLLTYSSSSDTDDEQLKSALKEIKKSLLSGVSSDEEIRLEKKRRVTYSSSSSSDFSRTRNNKGTRNSTPNFSDTENGNKKKIESSSMDRSKEKLEGKGSIDQMDENIDEQSNSSCIKMVRSKAKPGNCSSQNSDNQDTSDKDIDGLTNLSKLNTSHRRRGSTSSAKTENSNSQKKTSNAPKTSLIGEELLQAESSDAASLACSDGELEELPSVTIQKLNGSGIEHLGKDELLGESDSSISHNEKDKSSEEFQKEDETDEEHVKQKRRKANAISSDSEAGSSRRKKGERVSDFDDSEDEGSEAVKRKRKKKGSESDASGGSSSNEDSKKKRRRIKQLNDDSEGSGSDSETEGRNKHGRKNIRKVMGKNQLEEATKKAAREEKERIARISERQKLYNNLQFDESGKPDEVTLDKVVLDFDPETKEPLIEVDRGLVKKLKPHQANGIKFMWDACFESVKRIKKDRGSGCILAHCMGLGKTLQVVTLTHTLLIHSSLTKVNRVLVVCPLSTVLNWVNEFRMWLKYSVTDYEVDVYELSRYKQNSERAYQLQCWFSGGGVCVLGYEMFRNLSADNNKKYKKKMLRNFQEALVDPGPDLVVCDEGHLLKNEKTSLSQSMNRVKTYRRIVLTGTPLQNNLKEYYCMVQFVKPNLLGKYNEYLNRFVNPITNGQYTDSTEHDIRIMKRRSHVLHKMLDGAVQRRDYGVLAPFLPPKHEYVLFITLTEVQTKLYQFYLDNYSRRPLAGKSSGFLFPDFQSLQRIWTHPLVLKYNSERYEIMQQKKREREEEDSEGSLVDFIDDDSTPDESSTDESSDDLSDASDDSRKKSKKKKSAKKGKNKDPKFSVRRGTRANPEMDDEVKEIDEVVEVKNENPTEWWIKLVTDDEIQDIRNSHKLVLLFDILRQCEAIGDKLLVFSQSLYSLDLIEHYLEKVDEATQEGRVDEKLGGHVGSWSPGVDYFRLDGSTSCENRSIWCKNFNREDNPRARLFLISTRAGGLGINLVAANRVVIFDVSWNPSHDVQSIFRVYRFGQKKPCYVYRFLAMGTMEEKIYERQVTKQAISKRVIDEQQIDRHYAENDLAELYKFEPQPPQPRPLPPLPKDRLFAEMLREHEAQIYKYHEHDSMLENKEEETLSEEERKAAWEDFENEKNKPPPAPFPSPWPMHNGMVPGLLAQQQQQLAYAALSAMLRKDMPNMNDNQIRDMLPLIYNSNPGLMQKMSEIYKYAQQPSMMNQAMMNPAMMNSVMNQNSAGGAGGGGAMSGTSGLQYEPPWQRQHQQQQQIRLQQLMQQQNQMGAKMYAGGLGSRDPVAMALQQQRAREIMLGGAGGGGGAGAAPMSAVPGGGASRPRGRPPLQPRAHSSDVVNLDSD